MSKLHFEPSGIGIEKARSQIMAGGSLMPITIERPNRRQFAGEISEGIVLYLTGWIEDEESAPARKASALQGMAAATLDHPRSFLPNKVLRAAHLRAANVVAATKMLQEQYPSVSHAAHSMGFIDSARAVYEYELPLKVLAGFGGAGLIDTDNFQHVAPRVLNELLHEGSTSLRQHPLREGRFALGSFITVVRNPALAASEGISAATHYVGRHIPEICTRGVITANVMADGDKIFPCSKVLESTKAVPFDEVRIFENSCHNFTRHRPYEIAAYMINIIGRAEAIRAARNQVGRITIADVEQDLFGKVVS